MENKVTKGHFVWFGAVGKREVFEVKEGDTLALKEIAAIWSVSIQTVVREIKEGRLVAVKIRKTYRIRRKDYQNWVERCKVKALNDE